MTTSLNEIRNNDWLSNLFFRLNLKVSSVVLFTCLINVISDLLLAKTFNAFYPQKHYLGLQNNYPAWVIDFVAQPIALGFFFWMQKAGQILFGSLLDEGIFERNDFVNSEIDSLIKLLQNKWLHRVALLIGLIVGAVTGILFSIPPTATSTSDWSGVSPVIAWFRACAFVIVMYALVLIIFDLLAFLRSLNRIFQSVEIHVEHLHPDNAGGLGVIGKFSANLGFLSGVIGMVLTANYINAARVGGNFYDAWLNFNYIGIALYLIVAPALFYLPLYSAHIAMIRYRDGLLKRISNDFNNAYQDMMQKRQNIGEMESLLKNIQQLEQTYEITKGFVSWPFNSRNLRKFLGLVVIPILPALSAIIVNYVSSLLITP